MGNMKRVLKNFNNFTIPTKMVVLSIFKFDKVEWEILWYFTNYWEELKGFCVMA